MPGLGDFVGFVLAAGILLEAARRGASRATLGRMAYNIAVDAWVGAIPLLGDAFDAVWKANLRNLALLERHLADRSRAQRADRLFVVLLGGSLLLLCGVLLLGTVLLGVRLIGALAAH